MKKILFLASALLLGGVAFAQTQQFFPGKDFNHFDGSTVAEDGKTLLYSGKYQEGGWDFEGRAVRECEAVEVEFQVNAGWLKENVQVSLNASFFNANGEPFFSQTQCEYIAGAASGYAKLVLDREGREGWSIDKIWIKNGWFANIDKIADDDEEAFLAWFDGEESITITNAQFVTVCPPPVPVLNPIDFENFSAGYKFLVGEPYFPMPSWGWPDDLGATMSVVEKDGNNVLRVEPKNSDLTAIFKNFKLPDGKTVEDICSISFQTFFESFDDLAEGDDVMDSEMILYIGRPKTELGGGTDFANGDCISFKGNIPNNRLDAEADTWKVGVIGEWYNNMITRDDILDTDNINNKGDAHYAMEGWDEVAGLNQITFGVGINVNNGVYYIDNILVRFNDDPNCMIPLNVEKVVSGTSAKVVAIEGGLAIQGGEAAVIYGIDGRVVATTSASTIALPKGIYIVKIGSEVVKAIVK